MCFARQHKKNVEYKGNQFKNEIDQTTNEPLTAEGRLMKEAEGAYGTLPELYERKGLYRSMKKLLDVGYTVNGSLPYDVAW